MSHDDRSRQQQNHDRVAILVKGARDAELTRDILARGGLASVVCATMRDVCERIGEGVACVILAEEMLVKGAGAELGELLGAQPAWSDLPIVVFGSTARSIAAPTPVPAFTELGNVVVLDRPIHVRSMLASVNAAIRSRHRQYEARRAIEERDMFLAMLGHELRNPLAAIRMAVELLDRNWQGDPRPREISIAGRQAEHLTRLVDDLLDVARVTHGKLSLTRRPLDLVEVVRGVFETLEPRARRQSLAWNFEAPSELLWVDGDRARLDQIFANLVLNAIKYTPANGSITLRVEATAEHVMVAISDSGIGIAPDMVERIFDVFAQAEVALDRSQGGIGIGLALVRNLVRLHGGEVEAASPGLGLGATFRVRLPRREAPAPSVAPSAAPPRDPARRRIVVVEDNMDIRELFQAMLEHQGHAVACASDGPDGLERILAETPDIAFVDVGLPRFDGLELARRVRASGSSVRLVAVSGYGQVSDKQRALAAGFDDHLTKPVDFRDVERAIVRAGF